MAKLSMHIEVPGEVNPFLDSNESRRTKWRKLLRILKAMIGIGILARAASRPTARVGTAWAYGTVTCASVSAADTVTINGQNFTAANGSPGTDEFDMSGTNTADASDLVRCINASAQSLVSGFVKANNLNGTITLASVAAGEYVEVDGIRFTASAAATPSGPTEFSIAGNDTADAAALVTKINAHPTLAQRLFATSAAGVVTLRQLPGITTGSTMVKSGAGITLSVAALAATAVVNIFSVLSGKPGNAITLASSDGTRLAVSGARLTGGAESSYSF